MKLLSRSLCSCCADHTLPLGDDGALLETRKGIPSRRVCCVCGGVVAALVVVFLDFSIETIEMTERLDRLVLFIELKRICHEAIT
jgi:hypothetical protein